MYAHHERGTPFGSFVDKVDLVHADGGHADEIFQWGLVQTRPIADHEHRLALTGILQRCDMAPFRRTGIKPVVNAVTQRLGELDQGLGKFGEHCFSYSAAAVAAGESNWRNCASSRSMMVVRDRSEEHTSETQSLIR